MAAVARLRLSARPCTGTRTTASAQCRSSSGRPQASLPNTQATGPARPPGSARLGGVEQVVEVDVAGAVGGVDRQAGGAAGRRRRPRAATPGRRPAGGTGCRRSTARTWGCGRRRSRRSARRRRHRRRPRRGARCRRCPGRGRGPARRPAAAGRRARASSGTSTSAQTASRPCGVTVSAIAASTSSVTGRATSPADAGRATIVGVPLGGVGSRTARGRRRQPRRGRRPRAPRPPPGRPAAPRPRTGPPARRAERPDSRRTAFTRSDRGLDRTPAAGRSVGPRSHRSCSGGRTRPAAQAAGVAAPGRVPERPPSPCATSAAKAAASLTASSASMRRSTSTPAGLRPWMKRL